MILDDNKEIHVHLEKINQMTWWENVLSHHPKIDTTKITPENSKLSELDGETRAMVEKMMVIFYFSFLLHSFVSLGSCALCFLLQFDNQQKQMGKPTSDEQKKLEVRSSFFLFFFFALILYLGSSPRCSTSSRQRTLRWISRMPRLVDGCYCLNACLICC